jgi:hypothetical protein
VERVLKGSIRKEKEGNGREGIRRTQKGLLCLASR